MSTLLLSYELPHTITNQFLLLYELNTLAYKMRINIDLLSPDNIAPETLPLSNFCHIICKTPDEKIAYFNRIASAWQSLPYHVSLNRFCIYRNHTIITKPLPKNCITRKQIVQKTQTTTPISTIDLTPNHHNIASYNHKTTRRPYDFYYKKIQYGMLHLPISPSLKSKTYYEYRQEMNQFCNDTNYTFYINDHYVIFIDTHKKTPQYTIYPLFLSHPTTLIEQIFTMHILNNIDSPKNHYYLPVFQYPWKARQTKLLELVNIIYKDDELKRIGYTSLIEENVLYETYYSKLLKNIIDMFELSIFNILKISIIIFLPYYFIDNPLCRTILITLLFTYCIIKAPTNNWQGGGGADIGHITKQIYHTDALIIKKSD